MDLSAYSVWSFLVQLGIIFVAVLAFVSPLIDSVNASLNKTNDAIKIQMLENNAMNYDDDVVATSLNNN